jgi:16S rRNA (adenine1518-N6/adenine1519-N6)-dimethyltransferase
MSESHRPRRRFSQNFLRDPNTIERLLAAIAPKPGQAMVEIGPGDGALTKPLLTRAGVLTGIELDRDLADRLESLPGLAVVRADSREVDFTAMAREHDTPLRIVGNLPYNITTPLLFHTLEHSASITDIHFLLQREVVERLAAHPGNGEYGRLSVMVQYRCRVEPLFRVPSGAFQPAPRVTSQLVRLIPHARPPVHVDDEALFAEIVRQAFGKRRKTLRNALRPLLGEAEFESAGISPGERAEQLDLTAFAALTNARYARQDPALGW